LKGFFYSLTGGEVLLPNRLFGVQTMAVRHLYMRALIGWYRKTSEKRRVKILEVGSWTGSFALTRLDAIEHHMDGQGELTCCDMWEMYFDDGVQF